jgi:hypothetical protein
VVKMKRHTPAAHKSAAYPENSVVFLSHISSE